VNLTATLDTYFHDLERQDVFSGVALITQGDRSLYRGAFGYASRSWKVKNTLATRFDTASITKLFTSVAILQLIEQGLLAFETRVIDFLGLHDTTISSEVTIFHLLTHSSGIGDDADEEAGEQYEDLWKTKPNYAVTETADFLPQFMHKPANFAPGEGCRYCNCSFVLLGLLIEKVTATRYRDYVRQNIFARAQMADSDFLRMDRVEQNMAEGSDPIFDEAKNLVGWKRNIYAQPPIGSPDGGAYVTARDLDTFLRAVQAGKLLSAELTQAFLTPQVVHRQKNEWTVKYGFALEFFLKRQGEVDFYQKDGFNVGVSAIIRHFPAHNINVVLLSNRAEGVWAPIWEIHALLA
jgi:CubicO group peptidase (beta-lactamase class C family)